MSRNKHDKRKVKRVKRRKMQKMSKHKFRRKAGWFELHHLINECMGGTNANYNMVLLDAYKHLAYHLLFKHRTPKEAAEYLLRWDHMIEYRRFRNYYS